MKRYPEVKHTTPYTGTPDGRTESYIKAGPGGMLFAGPDAVELFRVTALATALRTYARSGMRMNRALTPTRMLALASAVTRKAYRRGEYDRAADDLKVWCDEMSAALPRVTD